MLTQLKYATLPEPSRRALYALWVPGTNLAPTDIEMLGEKLRETFARRGEVATDVVIVEGYGKETLRLHGLPYSVNRIRAAMFNAELRWIPIDLA